jgi:hypothetical protein
VSVRQPHGTTSGLLGFSVGAGHATWQVAVETGQVLAGLVTYPPDNPFFIYHVKIWSLIPQLSAVLLRAGFSEIGISHLLSSLLTAIAFVAIALFVYALGRDAVLAIGAPCLVFVTRVAEFGVIYPVSLAGTVHTYGAIGLAFAILVVAVIGVGAVRTGALLLGLAPAVHPSIGVCLFASVAVAAAWAWRKRASEMRPALPYLAAGAAITITSYLVQRTFVPAAPPIDPVVASRYLTQFVTFWDAHRQPVDFFAGGVKLNMGALAMALVFLIWFARGLPTTARFVLGFVAVCAAASLVLAVLGALPVGTLPFSLIVLMPSRMLNVCAMMFVPLLFGLCGVYRHRAIAWVLAAVLAIGLLLCDRSAFGEAWQLGAALKIGIDPLNLIAVVAVGITALAWHDRRARVAAEVVAGARADARPAAGGAPWIAARTVVTIAFAAAAIATGVLTVRQSAAAFAAFRDRTNDRVFAQLAAGTGMVATGADMQFVQLRSRRAVLIDGGGLDGLPYAIETAPAMDRILRDVYGIDLFDPPADARLGGRVPPGSGRASWESFSLARWQEIRRVYQVTDIVAPSDWQLELPSVAVTHGVRLYVIPD